MSLKERDEYNLLGENRSWRFIILSKMFHVCLGEGLARIKYVINNETNLSEAVGRGYDVTFTF